MQTQLKSELETAIEPLKLTLNVKATGQKLDTSGHTVNTYKVTVGDMLNRKATFAYFQGLGCKGDPTLGDVLYCLCSDATAQGMTFQEFADTFEYNSDSIANLKIYKLCKRNAKKLIGLLGVSVVNHLTSLEH